MKKQTRLYNVILPIWILILFPQLLVFVIPGNLLVDCAVLFFTLLALKHTQKGAVVKQLWWKFWLLGFAADAVGVVWMLLGVSIGARDPMAWLLWLGALALLYFLIWMVRWLGWYMELTAIRKKLGLTRQKKEGKTP